jgi:hypothetical protein
MLGLLYVGVSVFRSSSSNDFLFTCRYALNEATQGLVWERSFPLNIDGVSMRREMAEEVEGAWALASVCASPSNIALRSVVEIDMAVLVVDVDACPGGVDGQRPSATSWVRLEMWSVSIYGTPFSSSSDCQPSWSRGVGCTAN